MKKIMAVLMALLMLFSASGCGNSQKNASTDGSADQSAPVVTAAPEMAREKTEEEKEAEAAWLRAEEEARLKAEAEKQALTAKQTNSINMLNYLTVLVQEINSSKNSRLFLEGVYSDLLNNTEPSIVDELTLDEYEKILDIIEGYRMIAVKRERLQYIYNQNRAKSIRSAIPSPLALMNVIRSGSPLKALVSVVYLAVDSVNSYQTYTNTLDMQYLQDGWALDDEEAARLHSSRTGMFSYMVRVSRDLPKGITLNEEAVQEFVQRINDSNVAGRIQWLESNGSTYEHYGEYWLVLAKGYYEKAQQDGDEYYKKCLNAVKEYEKIDNSIFRKDTRLAQTLPYAITAAQAVLRRDEYVELASGYAEKIIENTNNDDWSLRYFAAQTFVDLYASTRNQDYLRRAYAIVLDNVNELIGEQRTLNETYLSEVVQLPTKNLEKEEEQQVKQYNKLLKETRETELVPVYEPLRVNCDLLRAIVEKLNLPAVERKKLDEIIHENGEPLFLNPVIDHLYWFNKKQAAVDEDMIEATYKKGEFSIPAAFVSEEAQIRVTVRSGLQRQEITDWTIKKVDRKKSNEVTDFIAVYESEASKEADYQDGATVTITVTNDETEEAQVLTFKFKAVEETKAVLFHPTSFERIG